MPLQKIGRRAILMAAFAVADPIRDAFVGRDLVPIRRRKKEHSRRGDIFMRARAFFHGIIAGAVTGTLTCAQSTAAQPVTDFYKRAEISMYVGSGSGGGFDAYARTLARHYARHIPGTPNIVVKNMPGASGLKAINYIYSVAPRDGSAMLASFNAVVLDPLYGKPGAAFDPRELSWIGSIGKQTGTCLTWHTAPVKTIEDARTQQVLVGATGADSTPNIFPKLLNAMIGTKFKII
jgi:tripartite-type tricarboxylate transporter receptor subunit TctC